MDDSVINYSPRHVQPTLWVHSKPNSPKMVDLVALQEAAIQLEILGVKHAPIHAFTEGPGGERCVLSTDAPGIYYICGLDNLIARADYRGPGIVAEIQVLFYNTPIDRIGELALALGSWTCGPVERLQCSKEVPNPDEVDVRAIILSPGPDDDG